MRIAHITDHFVKRNTRSGAYMRSKWDSETQTQTLRYRNGNPIADIFDYKDSKNFRLRVYPKGKYCGRTEHINRVDAVLRSVQMQDGSSDWDNFRYSGFIHYALRIHDRKTNAEYTLQDNQPLEFALVDGRLVIDYRLLESYAFPNETTTVELESNSNLRSVSTRLTNILQGV